MIITARATHISHSPRKVNLVTKSIVGLPAAKALEKLGFTIKRASSPVAKVLRQAIANATNNLKLPANSLFVDTAFATKGRTIKRGHFGGHMRYKPYEKIASHLTINLRSVAPKVPALKTNATNLPNKSNKSSIKPKTK
ncbi:50S ribosomal protein L22 [Candidatus Collierbacteria bacterium]|nr:50S ribosomal protein L22 [Candidatus Collierbacteria bacterium]